jgi:hypothetical protein
LRVGPGDEGVAATRAAVSLFNCIFPAEILLARPRGVCNCLHCMATMTKDATISIRLTVAEKKKLDADARLKGLPSGTVAAAYISEGVRRSRFPAIDFRNGLPGRVAYLTGTRWPVWLIVDLVEELKGDLAAVAAHMRHPAALVKMAMAYAAAYPQEIADCRTFAGDFAAMKAIVPELERA